MHQTADSANPGERSDHENQAKRHQDGGLQKICDDHRPQSAQHAVENDQGAGTEDGPGHRKTTGRRNKDAKPKQECWRW